MIKENETGTGWTVQKSNKTLLVLILIMAVISIIATIGYYKASAELSEKKYSLLLEQYEMQGLECDKVINESIEQNVRTLKLLKKSVQTNNEMIENSNELINKLK